MTKLTLKEIKKNLILDIIRSDGLTVLASSSPSSIGNRHDQTNLS